MNLARSRVVAVAAPLLVAALLVAENRSDGDAAGASPSPSATTGCTESEVIDRVQAFAEALQEPSSPDLRRAWGDRMEWFSVTKTRGPRGEERVWHFVARKRGKARRWVRKRGGLPLDITEVRGGSGKPKHHGHEGFQYEGRWRSKWIVGKGDMLCGSPQIRVWSMAIRDRPL